MYFIYLLLSIYLSIYQGVPKGVEVNVLGDDIVASNFELKSR